MALTASEKIKVIARRQDMTVTDLALKLSQSRQNLSNKLKRDNFNEKEMIEIANVLNCDYESVFVMRDTGDKI